jgi:hypothetical protein
MIERWKIDPQFAEAYANRGVLFYLRHQPEAAVESYATSVAALGAEVTLEVPAPLARLLASLEGVSRVVARGDTSPPFDCHCPLMSLPLCIQDHGIDYSGTGSVSAR